MKKIFALIVASTLLLSLAACGMSEAQRARNEIYSHLKAEAALDGVDLDALIASEQAAYEQRHEEFAQQQAQAQDRQAQAAPLLEGLETAYNTYKTATAGTDIRAAGERFNALFAEYMALAQDYASDQSLRRQLEQRTRRRTELPACVYRIKAAYADFTEKNAFHEAWCYFSLEADTAYVTLVGIDENTGLINDLRVLREDGTVCTLELGSVVTANTSYIQPQGMVDGQLLLNTIANADFHYYTFPLEGATAVGTEIEDGANNWSQFWFNNNLESFNTEEKFAK